MSNEYRFPLSLIYLSLQLLVLESGKVPGPLSWELEVARILTPAVATYAVLQALALIFREQFQLLRVRIIKNHVVICGLGEKGALLAKSFRKRGHPVVVIEMDEGNAMIDQCRDRDAIVLIGNATDPDLLCKARVNRANFLFSVCGEDGVNAEVAVHARDLVKDRWRKALTRAIHIYEPQLWNLLKEKEIKTGKISQYTEMIPEVKRAMETGDVDSLYLNI